MNILKTKIVNFFLDGNKYLAEFILVMIGFCFPIALIIIELIFRRDLPNDWFDYAFALTGFFAGLSSLLEVIRSKDYPGIRRLISIIIGIIGVVFFWTLSLAGLLVTLLGIQ
jgi:hypothetical protein